MFVGVDPPADILYTRFLKKGEVFRVAKLDTDMGLLLALYPSGNPKVFYGEACHKVDDESARAQVKRSEIKDPILRELLSGKPVKQIVRRYEPCLRDQYHLCRRGERDISRRLGSRTFEITEEQEELVSA